MRVKKSRANKQSSSWLPADSKPAWRLILGFIAMIAVLLLTVPALLIPLFPLGSLAIGIYLYRRYPILYVGFTWWIWFLGIFVKRLIDYRCNFITPWPYHFTPILVTAISIATLVRYFPKMYKGQALPFTLCCLAIFYGFFIGLVRQPTTDYDREIIILLNWLAPVCFSFHLFANWKDYPCYKKLWRQVFLWGVILMGTYGILQFLFAPGWDRFFLVQSSQFNSITNSSFMGSPVPLGMRVWSTMGNPMTFSFALMPGLILLLINDSKLRYGATAVGYLVFLIARVRTAWYSWLVSMFFFIVSLQEKHQIRALVTILLLVFIILPLTSIEPFSSVISSRFETFGDLSNDSSFQSRTEAFEQGIGSALFELLGYGLLSPGQNAIGDFNFSTNDNGYLVILASFGMFAAILYFYGICLILARLFKSRNLDTFAIASRAIAVGSLARIFTSNVSTEQYAMPIWGFLGIALAAHQYYAHQEKLAAEVSYSSSLTPEALRLDTSPETENFSDLQ